MNDFYERSYVSTYNQKEKIVGNPVCVETHVKAFGNMVPQFLWLFFKQQIIMSNKLKWYAQQLRYNHQARQNNLRRKFREWLHEQPEYKYCSLRSRFELYILTTSRFLRYVNWHSAEYVVVKYPELSLKHCMLVVQYAKLHDYSRYGYGLITEKEKYPCYFTEFYDDFWQKCDAEIKILHRSQ